MKSLHRVACLFHSLSSLHKSPLAFIPSPLPRTIASKFLASTQDLNGDPIKVAIIGAGPSGLLLAHRLFQFLSSSLPLSSIVMYESRSDPRKIQTIGGRAYALGLGARGRNAIRSVDEVLWNCVRNRGFQCDRFRLHFGEKLSVKLRDDESTTSQESTQAGTQRSDLSDRFITIGTNRDELKYDMFIGCDGANSIVRSALQTYSDDGRFSSTQRKLPGYFKVTRVPQMPPLLDRKSVALLLPRSMKSGVTAFVEPTIGGGGCILFAGRLAESQQNTDGEETNLADILFQSPGDDDSKSSVVNAERIITDQFPLLEGTPGMRNAVQSLLSQRNGIADTVKCNIYHSRGDFTPAAICGDAAHTTGGVSGQGCNSALVDAAVLADCLEEYRTSKDASNMRTMLRRCLSLYSEKQVPEGWALYDLSFGNDGKTLPIYSNIMSILSTAVDTIFQGRWGIGNKPLQTLLASSLTPFVDVRRSREKFFVEDFPSDEWFRDQITELVDR